MCMYIKLLILTKCDCIDHVQKLEIFLNISKESGIKCDIESSFFGKTKMEYLGFWVKYNIVISLNTKGRRGGSESNAAQRAGGSGAEGLAAVAEGESENAT